MQTIEQLIARAESAEREAFDWKKIARYEAARAERAEAEVSKLTDALDMMRDEFTRIIACPGCNAEIEDLANRAQLKLIQRVPVITQRDRAETELAKERARLDFHAHAARQLAAVLNVAGAPEFANAEHAHAWAEETAKERTRLDWLESNAGVDWQWSDAARTVSRESIDAFMKEEIK